MTNTSFIALFLIFVCKNVSSTCLFTNITKFKKGPNKEEKKEKKVLAFLDLTKCVVISFGYSLVMKYNIIDDIIHVIYIRKITRCLIIYAKKLMRTRKSPRRPFVFLADPSTARDCSTNTSVIALKNERVILCENIFVALPCPNV